MRTVTFAEAELDLPAVLSAAVHEQIRIQCAGRDVIVMSAAAFQAMQEELRRFGIREPWACVETEANGLAEGMPS
jgi:PHD/YefM family antitoxin component YafN of YafNO toxin-antitoxin module